MPACDTAPVGDQPALTTAPIDLNPDDRPPKSSTSAVDILEENGAVTSARLSYEEWSFEPVFDQGVFIWRDWRTAQDGSDVHMYWMDARTGEPGGVLYRYDGGNPQEAVFRLEELLAIDGSAILSANPALSATADDAYALLPQDVGLWSQVDAAEALPGSAVVIQDNDTCVVQFADEATLKIMTDASTSAVVCVRTGPWTAWTTAPVTVTSTPSVNGMVWCNYAQTSTRTAPLTCAWIVCGFAAWTWTSTTTQVVNQTITTGPQSPPCPALPPPGIPWTPPNLPP